MRYLTTLAAAAAFVLPTVVAEAGSGTFQLDFKKEKRAIPAARLSRRQTSKTVNSRVTNEETLYFINVTVGTPPQALSLQLDTGSSDIWFPSSSAAYCEEQRNTGCPYGSYDSSASSTYSNPGYGEFEIEYVDGTTVQGQYVSDVLTIGGTNLTNITMASATETGDEGFGIMGVGFPADESSDTGGTGSFVYENIIDKLVSEGAINTRSYSLWLDDLNANTGSILFGGVDSSKYSGSLIAIPIQKDADSGAYTSFTVAWTGLEVVGGGSTSNLSPSSAQPAILDSGTTELLLPDTIANSIFNGVGVVTDPEEGNLVPCSLANDSLTLSFQFGGSSGPRVNVSISEFVLPLESTNGGTPHFSSGLYKGQAACQFGIEAAGSDPILFGDTFLRSAYVVYDLDNLEIGMAQSNFGSNTNEDSVKAFTSGSGMPDATTTITSVVVSATASNVGPNRASSATDTGDAGNGSGAVTRTATYSLTTASSSSGSSSSSAANAAPGVGPSARKSIFAAIGATLAAFVFGTMLL